MDTSDGHLSPGRPNPDIGVYPYWELTFDADGHPEQAQLDGLVQGVGTAGTTDLVLFAHGWNNDLTAATRLYRRFFTPFPALLVSTGATAKVGYAGVYWPSMRFSDEPIPEFNPAVAPEAARMAAERGMDRQTLDGLVRQFPDGEPELRAMAELLRARPASRTDLDTFFRLVRSFTGTPDRSTLLDAGEPGEALPAMLADDPEEVCGRFAAALRSTGAAPIADLLPDPFAALWGGAREVLRGAAYYLMKHRAGIIGEYGLGPVLCRLAERSPGLRIHLVGHSFGGRLVSFALRALPPEPGAVKSVTLLEGAFSHYAFAASLPQAPGHSGALDGLYRRVDGPLVSCHSRHDTALGVFYPLASRLSGDDESLLGDFEDHWGAIGYSGVLGVPDAVRLTLADTAPSAGRPFPATGCVSVDAQAVVKRGWPPIGAHCDICHAELARVVLTAGRIT